MDKEFGQLKIQNHEHTVDAVDGSDMEFPRDEKDLALSEEESIADAQENFLVEDSLIIECIANIMSSQNQDKIVGETSSFTNTNETISPRDFKTLQDGQYLNDIIINAYLQMIAVETNVAPTPIKVCFFIKDFTN